MRIESTPPAMSSSGTAAAFLALLVLGAHVTQAVYVIRRGACRCQRAPRAVFPNELRLVERRRLAPHCDLEVMVSTTVVSRFKGHTFCLQPALASTRALLKAWGRVQEERRARHARWQARWRRTHKMYYQ